MTQATWTTSQELEKVAEPGSKGLWTRLKTTPMHGCLMWPWDCRNDTSPNDLRIFDANAGGSGAPWTTLTGPFVLAEKADDSCVVVDFRNLLLWACEQ